MNQIELTKERLAEVPGVLKQLENGILNGEINALELPIILASFEKWIKYAKENKKLQDCVQKEHLKGGKKSVNFQGATITLTERASWDYSVCNDLRLESVQKEIDYYTEQKNVIELELQARYKIDDFVNPVTGEVVEVVKPIKTTKTFFTVKL